MKREYNVRVGSKEFKVSNVTLRGDIVGFETHGSRYEVTLEESTQPQPQLFGSGVAQSPARRPIAPRPERTPEVSAGNTKALAAPISGVVVSVNVKVGETLTNGQTVAVLEAMKMENPIKSDRSGTIKSIEVSQGGQVRTGQAIVVFE